MTAPLTGRFGKIDECAAVLPDRVEHRQAHWSEIARRMQNLGQLYQLGALRIVSDIITASRWLVS